MATGTMRETGARALRRLLAPLIRRRRFNRDLAALSANDTYDDARRSLYRQFVPAHGLVFDVGANVGNRVKIFSEIARQVIAFEPQPYCLAVLREGFRHSSNVAIVPKAVGRAPGRSRMRVSDSHTLSSMSADWIRAVKASGRFAAQDWSEEIEIEVTTLDDAIAATAGPTSSRSTSKGSRPRCWRACMRRCPRSPSNSRRSSRTRPGDAWSS